MKMTCGTFEVPVRINNAVTTDFTVDSVCADVMVPAKVVSASIKSGTLREDYVGEQTYTLLPSIRFKLAGLRVGAETLTDVAASVAPSAGSALLGQSFLSCFASRTPDNTTGTLKLMMQIAAASAPSGTADPARPTAAPAPGAATATQWADATKPATGDVAPDKVAATSTAPSPAPDAGVHTGFVLPAFRDQRFVEGYIGGVDLSLIAASFISAGLVPDKSTVSIEHDQTVRHPDRSFPHLSGRPLRDWLERVSRNAADLFGVE